ncbi:MAG: cytidine deaminase, partial [Anaerotignaceae bacterium]
MENRELISLAKQAMQNAYAPYSNFKVGAAAVGKSGVIYTGCNIENSSYGATNCAERTAMFKGISEGEREFE